MSLSKKTGIVERVYVKELDKPQEFIHEGKKILTTHRYGIKLEGDDVWFSMTGSKPSLDFQDDDENWHPLGAGSEVMIKYEQNGDFRNTKKSLITVLNLVPGQRQKPTERSQSASQGKGATGVAGSGENTSKSAVDWSKKDAGVEAGHSVTNAVQLLIEEQGATVHDLRRNGKLVEALLEYARDVHAATRQLQQEILNPKEENKKSEEPKTTTKPKPAKKVVTEVKDDFVDDDIPF